MRKFLFFTCIIAMTFTGLKLIPGQSTQLPVSVIWNRIYNKAMGIPAEAQGTQRPIAEIINLLFNENTDTFRLATTSTTRPLTCAPSAEFFVNATTKCLEVCNAAGNGWDPQPGCGVGLAATTTGIRVSADAVNTLRYGVTTTTTDLNLSQHLMILALPGGANLTMFLPDPADPLQGGLYEVTIGDNTAGTIRMAPTAGATINGVSAPTATITGENSYLVAKRLSNTRWRVDAMTTLSE